MNQRLRKSIALLISAIMFFGLMPLDVLAANAPVLQNSNVVNLSEMVLLGAPDDGGTTSGVGTGGDDVTISIGKSVTITTARTRDMGGGVEYPI